MFAAFTWSPDAIWILTQKVWWFLIVLGVLVAFHELGHFLAARWVGVKVLKFSLGFGPKLFGRQVGETEYLVSAVPLGGYVKLFGEEETEALTPEDRKRAFVHQKLPSKFLIVAAGPGFNFLLAYSDLLSVALDWGAAVRAHLSRPDPGCGSHPSRLARGNGRHPGRRPHHSRQ